MSGFLPRAQKAKAAGTDRGGMYLSSPRLPVRRQFVVEKQGRFDYTVWNTRILTIDTRKRHIYLSKAQNAENLDHRCMYRIDSVELWPRFSYDRIYEPFDSEPARLTLCVTGLVGTKTNSLFMRLLGGEGMGKKQIVDFPSQVTEARNAAAQIQRSSRCGSDSLDTIEASTLSSIWDYSCFNVEVWVIRCMTHPDLYKMAKALRATITEASVMKGYHALKKRMNVG
ncbi:hypothetical protein JIQ42_02867 [Leishmania sp. Namibia]|uniref:hypothetical protein n=1 Tax=Leishmania sp. Namibia TaxID=2802991 RepID=UPI001B6C5D82|nr:hypothetical protein JIQ42_02867 [Leishmania sp. Namibia]